MKKYFLTIIILLLHFHCYCQDWTEEQLSKANTIAAINVLSNEEKNAIIYINLARLFPRDFVKIELEDVSDLGIENPSYTRSLIALLNTTKATEPLYFDNSLYEYAKCFAKESGDRGTVGHNRKNCKKGFNAECCSYGVNAGWDIALQWLIDDNVPELGHRKICLDKSLTKIAICIHTHKKYGVCAVADMGR